MKKNLRDSIVIGLALFATFFGAGNLIFPPFLGLQSGTGWVGAIVGFVSSGVLLPIVAVYAISYAGGSVEKMTDKIHPKFAKVVLAVIMLFCTFIAVPRTGAVAFELGVQALFPKAPMLPFIIIYFLATYYFVNDKNNVIDKIGSILTPALVTILIFIIIKGVITPVGQPVKTDLNNPFINAFLGGYQTGDLLVSYLIGGVIIADITRKGYTSDKERNKMTAIAGGVALLFLCIVYTGLLYQGAAASALYPNDIDRSVLILSIVDTLLGRSGLFALGIAVILACLTTAIGETTAIAGFFEKVTDGKLSYKKVAVISSVISGGIALLGVDRIIFISDPIFLAIYPILIVAVILGLFYKHVPKSALQGAALFTLIVSGLEVFELVLNIPFLTTLIDIIPLSEHGFAWIIPAIVGFVGGAIIGKREDELAVN
ncbi:MAG: branched-chain amino acid transport system II carrier protein [Tissierella sp.]|nr:branched-chain amino acid transport system II carrier protein [Tissierella sp.]